MEQVEAWAQEALQGGHQAAAEVAMEAGVVAGAVVAEEATGGAAGEGEAGVSRYQKSSPPCITACGASPSPGCTRSASMSSAGPGLQCRADVLRCRLSISVARAAGSSTAGALSSEHFCCRFRWCHGINACPSSQVGHLSCFCLAHDAHSPQGTILCSCICLWVDLRPVGLCLRPIVLHSAELVLCLAVQ